jgi:hypothetical protein
LIDIFDTFLFDLEGINRSGQDPSMVWEGYRTGGLNNKQYREDMFTGRLRVSAVDIIVGNGRDRQAQF